MNTITLVQNLCNAILLSKTIVFFWSNLAWNKFLKQSLKINTSL